MPLYIERILVVLESLNQQIELADAEMRNLASQDKVCVLLMTMPGVGPVTALRFRAAIDGVERFGDVHEVQSYLGLTPGEHSSSNTVRPASSKGSSAAPRSPRRTRPECADAENGGHPLCDVERPKALRSDKGGSFATDVIFDTGSASFKRLQVEPDPRCVPDTIECAPR